MNVHSAFTGCLNACISLGVGVGTYAALMREKLGEQLLCLCIQSLSTLAGSIPVERSVQMLSATCHHSCLSWSGQDGTMPKHHTFPFTCSSAPVLHDYSTHLQLLCRGAGARRRKACLPVGSTLSQGCHCALLFAGLNFFAAL